MMLFPPKEKPMDSEPTRIVTLINVAVAATIAVLALVLDWSGEVVAALTAAFGAWILVGGEILRSKVTPSAEVAVKTDGTVLNEVTP